MSKVIGCVYEIVDQPEHELLRALGTELGAFNVSLSTVDFRKGAVDYVCSLISQDDLENYLPVMDSDPWLRLGRARSVHAGGSVAVRGTDLLSQGEYRRTVHYDLARMVDVEWMAGCGVLGGQDFEFFLVANRSMRQGDFPADSTAFLSRILPHIARAIRIRENSRGEMLEDDVPRLRVQAGAEVVMNPCAQRWLAEVQGLRVRGRVLQFRDAANQRIFDRTVASGSALTRLSIVLGMEPYEMTVSRQSRLGVDYTRRHWVDVSFCPIQNAAALSLARRFGLTKAESELLELLVNGAGVREIAESRARSIHTVRTQLKALLRKTGSRSQSDLIRASLQGMSASGKS